MSDKKVILVIGATGAQGLPVVDHLLKPAADGSPSPWRVRALTRDATNHRAIKLQEQGVELVQGSFLDFDAVEKAMTGVYGAFVNTDGFTVGAAVELHAGVRIFEIAKRAKVRHYVYSSLDYLLRKGNWNPLYSCDHVNGKGRVSQYLKSQPNEVDDPDGTIWSILTTGPYMDMLSIGLFAPMNVRDDGTVVFAAPLGKAGGSLPLIALEDIGWWAAYFFNNVSAVAGKEIEIASEVVNYHEVVETFTRVTGRPAVYKELTIEEYWNLHPTADRTLNDLSATTYRQNFTAWWAQWRDGILKRDMEWLKSVHPETLSLESWMRKNSYDGKRRMGLKSFEDKKRPPVVPAKDAAAAL